MKIGFIGLGIMGESMCENLVKKNDDFVFCSDLNKKQVEKLEKAGAIPCENNIDVAKSSDVIISMVPKSIHVKAIYNEIMPYLKKGHICIDMSTIDPSVSVEIANKVKAKGAFFADAPVVKSKPQAIQGTLGILVGCDEKLFPVIEPILKMMGKTVIRMGENGKGLVMKICHNTLVGEIQNGVNETLLLAQKNGISIDDFTKAISAGGGQCFYLDSQHEKLKNEDYSTAFSIENMHKDLEIAQRLSTETGFSMPGLDNAKTVYDNALKKGMSKEDFRATIKVVKENQKENIH